MNRPQSWWRLAVIVGLTIVTFDALASIISRATGFPYTRFAIGSYIIQAGAGFFGRRSGLTFLNAALLGTWVGLIEATIGWAVSWWIGPGRVESPISTELLMGIVIYVAIGATVLGALGSLVGGIRRASPQSEA